MALADALRSRWPARASTAVIIRKAWRTMAFDQATQQTMLYRFHDVLKQPDIEAREDFLLYGAQGPAAIGSVAATSRPTRQAVANVRMALRRNDPNAAGDAGRPARRRSDQPGRGL